MSAANGNELNPVTTSNCRSGQGRLLHRPETKIPVGNDPSRDRDHPLGRVDAADQGAATGCNAAELAAPAADIQHSQSRRDARRVGNRLPRGAREPCRSLRPVLRDSPHVAR